ncbi:MAG: M23 family metallopeptidase [Gemmatimonadota bacterium]|nr:MAG: M23 family metallopeptidase [Gemmatimonadota bacterium]
MPNLPNVDAVLLTASILAGLGGAGCAAIPDPPEPLPAPEAPQAAAIRLDEPPPDAAAPRPLAPRIHWTPATPAEGTLAVLTLEPMPQGLPAFEMTAGARDNEIALARLKGGAYFGLVAVPLNTDAVPVEVNVTFIDGTRLTQHLSLLVERQDFPTTGLSVASRFTAPDEQSLERIRREREIIRAALAVVSKRPLWTGAFILPRNDATTSPYGQRRLFNNQLRSRHTGLDIRGRTGDAVYAANSGRVILARELFYSGNAVYIDHGLGLVTGYFHLSERAVREGQWVDKGQLIGRVGATGRVTGPHLHWGLYLQGAALDPRTLLELELTEIGDRLLSPPAIVE